MNTRPLLILVCLSALLWTACPAPAPAPVEDVAQSTDLGDVTKEDTARPPGLACCPSGVCVVGEICVDGACHGVPGTAGCFTKGGCSQGQECVGATTCPCEDENCVPDSGTCSYPEGCCNSGADCGGTERCINGVCHQDPKEGRCYDDGDCTAGLGCQSAALCTCGEVGCAPISGVCAVPGPCCIGDEECGPGGLCVGDACEPTPQADACFSSDGCDEGLVCAGATICPCDMGGCLIPTTEGVCADPEKACCQINADCAKGEVCVDGAQCVTAPDSGNCYKDAHCGKGRTCQGATVCECGGDDCENVAGTCHTEVVPCEDDLGCGPGMRCIAPDETFCPFDGGDEDVAKQSPGPERLCVADVKSGCWSRGDCAHDERCLTDVVCVDPAGCAPPNTPGKCESRAEKDTCCTSHQDCQEGLECRNSNSYQTCPPAPTAVCLPKPDFGINCWNYEDCPDAQVCIKSRICACGARCFKSGRGWCEPASAMGCNSDLDCGESYSCARDLECVLNPCNASNNCPLGGMCEPDMPGSCWNHKDCGDGNYCQGLRICPADAVCDEIDKPGACAPKEEIGACCDSYLACQPGLRCVSGINESQCKLDVTSICVPYGVFNESCFTDEECADNRHCVGQVMCGCGIEGCDVVPAAGQCVLK
jgi:hypothetical protein